MCFLFRVDLSLHAGAGKKFRIWNFTSKHGLNALLGFLLTEENWRVSCDLPRWHPEMVSSTPEFFERPPRVVHGTIHDATPEW